MNEPAKNESGWCPEFNPQLAIFDDLRALYTASFGKDWPSLARLNRLLPPDAHTISGRIISFVRQAGKMTALEYEQQIWRSGRVPTRAGKWHDLFNALMWSLFPRSKARLNAMHVTGTDHNSSGQRSPLRDALTLIDECGIVIASSSSEPENANLKHDWQSLFVATRDQWFVNRRPLIVGHGLYQQCLQPYLGLTAKALYVEVEAGFFESGLADQYRHIDDLLQDLLQQRGLALRPSDLLAFPLLGVPGWHSENQLPRFYRQTDYFRPRKR